MGAADSKQAVDALCHVLRAAPAAIAPSDIGPGVHAVLVCPAWLLFLNSFRLFVFICASSLIDECIAHVTRTEAATGPAHVAVPGGGPRPCHVLAARLVRSAQRH